MNKREFILCVQGENHMWKENDLVKQAEITSNDHHPHKPLNLISNLKQSKFLTS
jgi:hypothetical protein